MSSVCNVVRSAGACVLQRFLRLPVASHGALHALVSRQVLHYWHDVLIMGGMVRTGGYIGNSSPSMAASGDGVVPDLSAPPAKRQHV